MIETDRIRQVEWCIVADLLASMEIANIPSNLIENQKFYYSPIYFLYLIFN